MLVEGLPSGITGLRPQEATEEVPQMVELEKPRFDVATFLANAGLGRSIVHLAPKDAFFSQGEPADSVFYLQVGRARVTVVSATGKEGTITLLSAGDFVGEESLGCVWRRRLPLQPALPSKSVGKR